MSHRLYGLVTLHPDHIGGIREKQELKKHQPTRWQTVSFNSDVAAPTKERLAERQDPSKKEHRDITGRAAKDVHVTGLTGPHR